MKAVLARYLMAFVALALGVAALDYLNFPLSPTNFLNRLYAIDLEARVGTVSQEQLQAWMEREGGVDFSVQDADGQEILRQSSDARGRLRLYLHPGRYQVVAQLATMSNAQRFLFFKTPRPVSFSVDGKPLEQAVELGKQSEDDALDVVAFLERLLLRGELDRVSSVLRSLNIAQLKGGEALGSRIEFIRRRLDEGAIQLAVFSQLEPSSYNSRIIVLTHLQEIVDSLTQGRGSKTIVFGGERFSPEQRKRSLSEARDSILGARFRFAEQALQSKALLEGLTEYQQALSDPELWRAGQEMSTELKEKADSFQARRAEIVDQARSKVLKLLRLGVNDYQKGDLDKAQDELSRVLQCLEALRGELEMPDTLRTANTYLRDLRTLVEARQMAKQERWADAYDAYSSISNVNPLVRQGLAELKGKR